MHFELLILLLKETGDAIPATNTAVQVTDMGVVQYTYFHGSSLYSLNTLQAQPVSLKPFGYRRLLQWHFSCNFHNRVNFHSSLKANYA